MHAAGATPRPGRAPSRLGLGLALLCAAASPARAATFTDATSSAGADSTSKSVGAAFADYDNDGHVDLFVTNNAAANALLRNDGDGTFTDATASAGLSTSSLGNSNGACWGDFDADGDVDLYVAIGTSGTANVLYENQGDGTFAEVAAAAGVGETNKGQDCNWVDIDGDGDVDLYVTVYGGTNVMYRNDGDGTSRARARARALRSHSLGDSLCGPFIVERARGRRSFHLSPSRARARESTRALMFSRTLARQVPSPTSRVTRVSPRRATAAMCARGAFERERLSPTDIWPFTGQSLMSARVLRTPLLQAAWIDYDGDGDMDLFHNIDNAQDKLLVNDGSGVFTNVGERASASRPRLCDMRLTTSNRARVLAGGLDRRRQRRLESGFVRLGVGRLG